MSLQPVTRFATFIVALCFSAPAWATPLAGATSEVVAAAEPSRRNPSENAGQHVGVQERDVAPATSARAQRRAFHLDLETDPTAFAFNGYSLHAGLGYRHVRLDLGVYAMDVPGFVETNDGFESSFRGAGAKLQLFLFDEQKGGFVGIDGGMNQLRIQESRTSARDSQWQGSLGVNLGWRFVLPFGFYATPWLGLGYALNAKDMSVAGKTYNPNSFTIFPAVHVGYRFL
ncbi:MAG TPA: hypothetical protein VFQ35_08890 [Polyangiaceae bacterium]|nr:hypothetical protein [Polyangiaceae bacterium]